MKIITFLIGLIVLPFVWGAAMGALFGAGPLGIGLAFLGGFFWGFNYYNILGRKILESS